MTHVLHVLHVLTDDRRRGAQVFGSSLARRLDELGLSNTTVALVGGSSGGMPVPGLGSRARGPETIRTLRRLMADADITVAHGSSTLQACAIAGIGRGRPFVYRQISDPVHWSRGTLRRARTHVFYRFPRHVVSLSERTAGVLCERFAVHRDRITVIPNAADERTLRVGKSASRREARAQLSVSETSSVLAYVGALTEEKGVFDLIDAVGRRHVLLVAGEGPAAAELDRRAAQRGVDIRLLGPVADPTPVYLACDLLVLPSWSEQQPGVLLEAALVGTPAVATEVGLVGELLAGGQAGHLVQAHDPHALRRAIEEALSDRPALRRLGEAARRHVEAHYSLAAVAPAWAELLERLTA
jgi:glycosyltransferase involved in cell wall biosynthesis